LLSVRNNTMYAILDASEKPVSVSVVCDEHYKNPETRYYAAVDASREGAVHGGQPVWTEVDVTLPCVACGVEKQMEELIVRESTRVYTPVEPLADWEREALGI
jgi:hypothetical protein